MRTLQLGLQVSDLQRSLAFYAADFASAGGARSRLRLPAREEPQ